MASACKEPVTSTPWPRRVMRISRASSRPLASVISKRTELVPMSTAATLDSATDLTLQSDQGEQLHARGRVVEERAVQLAGGGPRARLLHAAVTHAEVLALHDHGHALRLQV